MDVLFEQIIRGLDILLHRNTTFNIIRNGCRKKKRDRDSDKSLFLLLIKKPISEIIKVIK